LACDDSLNNRILRQGSKCSDAHGQPGAALSARLGQVRPRLWRHRTVAKKVYSEIEHPARQNLAATTSKSLFRCSFIRFFRFLPIPAIWHGPCDIPCEPRKKLAIQRSQTTFRRITMKALMIKDLAASKQLGSDEMSAVRGGSNYNFGNQNVAYGGGAGSSAIVDASVTQVDVTSHTTNNLLENFGGKQFALIK